MIVQQLQGGCVYKVDNKEKTGTPPKGLATEPRESEDKSLWEALCRVVSTR
jgi:hypothetical protein